MENDKKLNNFIKTTIREFLNEQKINNNENNLVINNIEHIVQSNRGKYLSTEQYDKIKKLMLNNKSDMFNFEPENIPSDLLELIEDNELYYGFNENEIKRFLNSVRKLGYTFNYIDMATKDNGGMNHTVKPYALRKI